MIYRKEIDGLRALALLPVILCHAGFSIFSGGFVGVDVFFVISGYLITSIILNDLENGTFSLAGFYDRRVRRILPALFLVVLVTIPFAWLWMLPVEFKDFAQSVAAVSTFSSNLLFWKEAGYFETTSDIKPLLHTWSLAVEEQYYVIFPLIMIAFWKLGKRWLTTIIFLIAIASLLLAQMGGNLQVDNITKSGEFHWFNQPDWASYYLATGRAWELMIGAMIAFYLRTSPQSDKNYNQLFATLGLVLIMYAVFTFDKATPFPSVYTLIPTIGTGLIILFASPKTLVYSLLASPILVGVGLISYSAYLWHQPIFALARIRNINEPAVWQYLILIALTLVLAYFSWTYVEKPARKSKKFDKKLVFGAAVVGSLAMISFGVAGHITDGFEYRVPQEVKTLVNFARDMNPRREECLSGMSNYIKPKSACVSNKEAPATVALYGDSHGDTLVTGLENALQRINLNMVQLNYKGCAPVTGLQVVGQSEFRKCQEYSKDVHTYLNTNKDITHIILVARWALYLEKDRFDNKEGGVEKEGAFLVAPVDNNAWKQSESLRKKLVAEQYIKSINSLLALNKKIILVYPIPEVGWEVPEYLARANMLGIDLDGGLSTSYNRFKERNASAYAALDALGEHQKLIRIKPADILCNTYVKDRCVAELGGKPLYYDNNHLNKVGSALIAKEIAKHLL